MNKADLKQVWGNYCDTDKLVDDMMTLLPTLPFFLLELRPVKNMLYPMVF